MGSFLPYLSAPLLWWQCGGYRCSGYRRIDGGNPLYGWRGFRGVGSAHSDRDIWRVPALRYEWNDHGKFINEASGLRKPLITMLVAPMILGMMTLPSGNMMIRETLATGAVATPRHLERLLSSNAALWAVLLLAAGLRVWHVFSLRDLPLFEHLIIDSQMYDQWAQQIATGNWIGGDRPFYMDPLYPYVLAVLNRIFGRDLLAFRLFQAFLGVATCGLVGVIGRRVGGRAVGTFSAMLLALYQPLVFEGGEIEKTALGVFLITAALAFATGRSGRSFFGAGVCLALATFTRGNLLLLVPLGAVFFVLTPVAQADLQQPSSSFRRLGGQIIGKPGRNAVAFLLGVLLILSPVLWRNHYVSGEWILTTSQFGQNFYTGNNLSNWSGAFTPVPFVRPLAIYEEEDFRAKAEQLANKRLSAQEVSLFWFRKALEHIAQNPGFATMVFLRKTTLFWSDLEIPDGWSMYFLREFSPALHVSFITLGWLLPLALLGAIGSYRSGREVRFLLGYVIVYSLSVVTFFVFSRYRIYVVPPLAVLAALGLKWIWDHAGKHDWRQAILPIFAACCVGVFSFLGAPIVGLTADQYMHNYAHLAELYQDEGDIRSAEALLQEALRRQPGAASTLTALGSLHLRTGDTAGALMYLQQAVRADERYPNAWFMLGLANEKLQNLEEARRCFWRQLDIMPGHRQAMTHLRKLMAHPTKTGPSS